MELLLGMVVATVMLVFCAALFVLALTAIYVLVVVVMVKIL